ncbi:hypothetical protein [Corynebacterium doosanense]|nr:hypothetical protein [Corynebacterium doosanense]
MTKKATLLILGGASDLARRLLIPGAANFLAVHPEAEIDIVGVGTTPQEDYPGFIRSAVQESELVEDESVGERLAKNSRFIEADATDDKELARVIGEANPETRLVIYCALPPSVAGSTIDALCSVELPVGTVLAIEKPIGTDAPSAADVEKRALKVVDESHLYRVDHFLQQSAVSSLIGLLALNRPLLDSFRAESVESVDFVYEETLALEGRAGFYDSTGATRDMHQSHLIQVVMHILAVGGDESVADLLEHASADPANARRGQYTAGEIDGHRVPAYTDEEGIDESSTTETLSQVQIDIDTDRWRGVPVRLRSGKAFGTERKDLTITYLPSDVADGPRTRIVITFDDVLHIQMHVTAGLGVEKHEPLEAVAELHEGHLSPYARVVRALVAGDHRREVPAGTAARAWEVLQPVLDAFDNDEVELEKYPAGSDTFDQWSPPGE